MVTLFSLLDRKDVNYGRPDLFSYFLTFEPAREPIHCLSIGITQTPKDYLSRTTWTLRDALGNNVQAISLPIRKPEIPDELEIVHFFDHSLVSGKYNASFIDESRNSMPGFLTEERRDDLVFFPRRADGPVGRINLILSLPDTEKCRKAAMSPKAYNDVLGRPMTKAELADKCNQPKFFVIGWTVENITVTKGFGVDIIL